MAQISEKRFNKFIAEYDNKILIKQREIRSIKDKILEVKRNPMGSDLYDIEDLRTELKVKQALEMSYMQAKADIESIYF